MADLTVRRGAGGGNIQRGGGQAGEGDPFGMVRESMRRMQDLFRDPLFEVDPIGFLEAGRMTQFVPDFEVRESPKGLVFVADLPGVKEDDLDITVVGNRLRINGRREFEQESRGDTWYAAERAYGTFTRTFILPEGIETDHVDANLENGVLTICIPKGAQAQPRRIALGGQQKQRSLEGQYTQEPQYTQETQYVQQPGQPGQQYQNQQPGYPAGYPAQPSGERASGEQQPQQSSDAQRAGAKIPEKV
ncbi:MAG: Hsp20/alpha crystallin family protein [Pseudomonadota bacterium]|nr:Hsp20/alpha crystallin family protein [Pseudomonadota bacterium]